MKKSFLRALVILLVLVSSIFVLSSCDSGSSTPEPQKENHVCEHVCSICNKCTDASCTDSVCAVKCQGHKLAAPTISLNENVVSWVAVTNATGYEVFVNGTSKGTQAAVTYTISETNEGDYKVKVVAKANGYTQSDASNEVTYTVAASHTCNHVCSVCDKCTDATCTDSACAEKCQGHTLAAPVISLSENVVSWTAVTNATGYEVFVNGVSKGTQTTVSYTISETEAGDYKVKVVANATGYTDSSYSNEVTYTIAALPVQEDGKIVLDDECYRSNPSLTYTVTYGDYDFELSNVSSYEDGYITLSKGGYILNTTAFGDIDSFKVEYKKSSLSQGEVQSDLGFGSLYYVTDTHAITSPRSYQRVEVANNTLVDLSDNPNFIAFYTFNEIEITSITINYNTDATYTETLSDFNVTLFASNDIHGQVNADSSHAGLVNAVGFVEDQKTKYNILLDQGDIYQGSLACYLTEGHIMDDYLLSTGFESTILGNHEWDWMEPNILEHREYSPQVQLLACNVRYKDGSTPDWVRNYYITERGGVKFGVIGALGDIAGDISADMIENIMFVTGTELTNMIAGFADELKAQGCSYVILQIHAGSNYSGNNLETQNPGYTEVDYSKLQNKVNVVLESHSHRAYYHYDNYGILHIQCGGYLSALGKITLQVSVTDNTPSVSIKNVYIANASKLKQYTSTFFTEVNDWYSANVYKEESERVVATLESGKTKAEIEQMQAEAYLNLKNIYTELSSYDVAVAGGHIGARSPQKLEAGNVTTSDIANLFPFDNEMYLVKINGKELKYGFLKDTYKLAGTLNASSSTNFNSYYYIILDSYNYFYLTKTRGYTSLSIEVNLTELYGIHPRDAFEKYLGQQYPVKEEYTFEIDYETFDYTLSSKQLTNNGVTLSVEYSGLAANGTYPQFIFNNNGAMTISCPNGYVISGIVCEQYGTTYENIHFFSDLAGENAITYSFENKTYTMTNTTGGIKLTSTYNTKIVKITLTVTKTK